MIIVNQHTHLPWREEMTVQDVLQAMSYTFPHVIVTVNGQLVPHDQYGKTVVPDDADVRVIHLIAGG